jgi:hypothetical protein
MGCELLVRGAIYIVRRRRRPKFYGVSRQSAFITAAALECHATCAPSLVLRRNCAVSVCAFAERVGAGSFSSASMLPMHPCRTAQLQRTVHKVTRSLLRSPGLAGSAKEHTSVSARRWRPSTETQPWRSGLSAAQSATRTCTRCAPATYQHCLEAGRLPYRCCRSSNSWQTFPYWHYVAALRSCSSRQSHCAASASLMPKLTSGT